MAGGTCAKCGANPNAAPCASIWGGGGGVERSGVYTNPPGGVEGFEMYVVGKHSVILNAPLFIKARFPGINGLAEWLRELNLCLLCLCDIPGALISIRTLATIMSQYLFKGPNRVKRRVNKGKKEVFKGHVGMRALHKAHSELGLVQDKKKIPT